MSAQEERAKAAVASGASAVAASASVASAVAASAVAASAVAASAVAASAAAGGEAKAALPVSPWPPPWPSPLQIHPPLLGESSSSSPVAKRVRPGSKPPNRTRQGSTALRPQQLWCKASSQNAHGPEDTLGQRR